MDMRESLSITILTFFVRNYMGKILACKEPSMWRCFKAPCLVFVHKDTRGLLHEKVRGLV